MKPRSFSLYLVRPIAAAAASVALLLASRVGATTYTATAGATTWSSTTSWTPATGVPSVAGDIATRGSTSSQVTLDTPETVGQLSNTAGSASVWTISGTSSFILSDAGVNNPFGNAWSSIRTTSSGGLNLGSNTLSLANNLDIGATGSNNANAIITIAGSITASTSATIFFRNNNQGETISGDIGDSGSAITLDNVSSHTTTTGGNGGAVNISGALGPSVTSVIENITGNTTQTNSTITISHANSSFSGSVSVLNGILTVSGSGTLGNNNVINVGPGVDTAGAHLNLNSVSTALGAGATLDTITGSIVNLGYTGTDVILALSLDGGSTFVSPGIWGSVASGAPNTSSIFTGLGTITINSVPEPATWALLSGAVTLLAALRRRQHA